MERGEEQDESTEQESKKARKSRGVEASHDHVEREGEGKEEGGTRRPKVQKEQEKARNQKGWIVQGNTLGAGHPNHWLKSSEGRGWGMPAKSCNRV